jgi:magnesium chelatase family protein
MNLCPCGARGDPAAECSCSAARLAAYRDKLSRALLDRFDLLVTLPRPDARDLAGEPGEPSQVVQARVLAARERGRGQRLCRSPAADELLSRAVEQLPLSARGRARVGRVGHTIALLAGCERVEVEHVAEALSFRSPTEFRRR